MTPNTDSPDYGAPDAADYDAAPPDSLILDSSIKRKIDPNSMLELKIIMTVTNSDTATDDAYPDAINTSPHVTNVPTSPDAVAATAENKTSVRKLLYGQKYHITKFDIIQK